MLGIDPDGEVAASTLAAAIGIAPEIVAHDEELGCLVSRFVVARPITAEEMARPPMLGLVTDAVRRVHGAGRIDTVFDFFTMIERYHGHAARAGCGSRSTSTRRVPSSVASRRPARSGPPSSATTTFSTPTSSSTGRCASSTGSTRA